MYNRAIPRIYILLHCYLRVPEEGSNNLRPQHQHSSSRHRERQTVDREQSPGYRRSSGSGSVCGPRFRLGSASVRCGISAPPAPLRGPSPPVSCGVCADLEGIRPRAPTHCAHPTPRHPDRGTLLYWVPGAGRTERSHSDSQFPPHTRSINEVCGGTGSRSCEHSFFSPLF